MDEGKRVRETYKVEGKQRKQMEDALFSVTMAAQGRGSAWFETARLYDVVEELKKTNPNVTFTAAVGKLYAESMREHSDLNTGLVGLELSVYESVNVGFDLAINDEVQTIVVKEVQDKSVIEVSNELAEYIAAAKAGTLAEEHRTGATCTLVNMELGFVEQMSWLLHPAQTSNIIIGMTKRYPVVDKGADDYRITTITCFSATTDHGPVDGLHGGQHLGALKDLIENPDGHLGL